MKVTKLLPAFALAACTTATPPRQTTGTPTAGLHQTANVESLYVTPLDVVEDSRCPLLAQCVWAGRLVVRTSISFGSQNHIHDLTMGEPQHVADGEITLVHASPDKQSRPTQPGDYRFTFSFSGGL